MLYPVPAVLVSVADSAGNDNLITIAWTGTVCSDPCQRKFAGQQIFVVCALAVIWTSLRRQV